ncbi:MAG: peptidoglycan-binding protein [Burkholderiales bacterium RIFCSPLOWO2_02_FULL_57_36]|nr:MAG: peptidoglycan-binding protein [Burkholderiales bacterium RIFCSPLOWO2_02_FULL_57_36]
MKKFSTAGFLLVFASALTPLSSLAANPSPSMQAMKETHCEFLANAPDQHLVVRGDTLWGISSKFLQHPWCWPQVWGLNRDQIRDPHWIYPGQIVYLDRAAGRLRLGSPTGANGTSNVRLSPRVRVENLGQDAISAIPSSAIEPFLSQPLIIDENELKNTPRIIAAEEGHVFLGKGDKAYVRGDLKGNTLFQVFRPGKPLKDPVTKAILGYEAPYLGTLKLDRAAKVENEAHRFVIVTSKEEMGIGDHLVPMPPTPIINFMPHAPATTVDARVMSVYGGVTQAGQNQIISINRGKKDGIDVGTVLHLSRFGKLIADRTNDKKPIKLPDEQYGTLFVFRVFNNISYGLIMQVTDAVSVGDVVKSPE